VSDSNDNDDNNNSSGVCLSLSTRCQMSNLNAFILWKLARSLRLPITCVTFTRRLGADPYSPVELNESWPKGVAAVCAVNLRQRLGEHQSGVGGALACDRHITEHQHRRRQMSAAVGPEQCSLGSTCHVLTLESESYESMASTRAEPIRIQGCNQGYWHGTDGMDARA